MQFQVDFRMNQLLLTPEETSKFTLLEHLTHLDIRDNKVGDIDLKALKTLEYLNCGRNEISSIQINGLSLKNFFAPHNCEYFSHVEWYQLQKICKQNCALFPYLNRKNDKTSMRKLILPHF